MSSQETPSFQRVNYSIRTNKNIERKLIFDALMRMPANFHIDQYRYLGFGSMWFVDFIFAHRLLRISSMWSMEHEKSAGRADYNRPYDCIEIKSGTSTEVLTNMAAEHWQVPIIAWLDYDGRFDQDVRSDCEMLLTKARAGSVIIVTVNAYRNSYRTLIEPGEYNPSVSVLKELFGDALPTTNLPSDPKKDIEFSKFPGLLASSILNLMTRSVRMCGRGSDGFPDRFVPLFSFEHNDGAPMITVGGVVAEWRQIPELEAALEAQADALFEGAATIKETLDLVPITIKEKLALDRLLPADGGEFNLKFGESGIKLSIEQAQKYRRLYAHFPVFAETLV